MKNTGPQDTAPIVVSYSRACDACGATHADADEYVCATCKARFAARRAALQLAQLSADLNSATVIASNPTRAGWSL